MPIRSRYATCGSSCVTTRPSRAGGPVDLEVTTVAPDSLRATEPFTLRLAPSRGPSPLLCDTAVLYRRRAVLRCAGDYRMTIRPCRPVRGIEAVGVTIEKSI